LYPLVRGGDRGGGGIPGDIDHHAVGLGEGTKYHYKCSLCSLARVHRHGADFGRAPGEAAGPMKRARAIKEEACSDALQGD